MISPERRAPRALDVVSYESTFGTYVFFRKVIFSCCARRLPAKTSEMSQLGSTACAMSLKGTPGAGARLVKFRMSSEAFTLLAAAGLARCGVDLAELHELVVFSDAFAADERAHVLDVLCGCDSDGHAEHARGRVPAPGGRIGEGARQNSRSCRDGLPHGLLLP